MYEDDDISNISKKYKVGRKERDFAGSMYHAHSKSKEDGHNKHYAVKQNLPEFGSGGAINKGGIYDCYVSRVLNRADAIEGKPKNERSPKSKIVTSEYTASRVIAMEGQEVSEQTSYKENDLNSYLKKDDSYGKTPLTEVLNTLVDAVIIESFDIKTENLTAPVVKNFDLNESLNSKVSYSKEWSLEQFESIIKGTSNGQNKIPQGVEAGSSKAIAHALTQNIGDFGTRVTDQYSGVMDDGGYDSDSGDGYFNNFYDINPLGEIDDERKKIKKFDIRAIARIVNLQLIV